jgi:hypothetical protein
MLAPQEAHHVVNLRRVERGANDGGVDVLQVVLGLEDDVGGVLDLHQAPLEGAAKLSGHRAERRGEAVERLVQRLDVEAVRELLGGGEVVDAVIVWGLLSSTVLTLFVVPVLYAAPRPSIEGRSAAEADSAAEGIGLRPDAGM